MVGHKRNDPRSAGGAAEGSQRQALGAPPLGYVNNPTALKGRKEPRKPEYLEMLNCRAIEYDELHVLVMLAAPFQGVIVLVGLIQGLRAKPLALGYPLPRLRRWLS